MQSKDFIPFVPKKNNLLSELTQYIALIYYLSPPKTVSVFSCVCEAQQDDDEARSQDPPSAPIR